MSDIEPIHVHAETFVAIPVWLLEDRAVSHDAIRLYLILRRSADTGERHPFRQTLADRLGGCSLRHLARLLHQLVDAGAIRVVRRTRAGRKELTSSHYYVLSKAPTPPDEVDEVVTQESPGGDWPVTSDHADTTQVVTQESPQIGINTESGIKTLSEASGSRGAVNAEDSRNLYTFSESTTNLFHGPSHPSGGEQPSPTPPPRTPAQPSEPATPRRKDKPSQHDRLLVECFTKAWRSQHLSFSVDDPTLPRCGIPNMRAAPKENGDRWRLIVGAMRHLGADPARPPSELYEAIATFLVNRRAREEGWEVDTFCRHVEKWVDRSAHLSAMSR